MSGRKREDLEEARSLDADVTVLEAARALEGGEEEEEDSYDEDFEDYDEDFEAEGEAEGDALSERGVELVRGLARIAWQRREVRHAYEASCPARSLEASPASMDRVVVGGAEDVAFQQRAPEGGVVRSIEELLAAAVAAEPGLRLLCAAACEAAGARAASVATRVKGAARAAEKAESDYGSRVAPCYSWLHDALGARVVLDDEATVLAVFAALAARADVVRVKNRFAVPTPCGFRDLSVLLRPSDGHGFVCEVQLHLSCVAAANKAHAGHALYEQFRSYFAGDDARAVDQRLSLVDSVGAELVAAGERGASEADAKATVPLRRRCLRLFFRTQHEGPGLH